MVKSGPWSVPGSTLSPTTPVRPFNQAGSRRLPPVLTTETRWRAVPNATSAPWCMLATRLSMAPATAPARVRAPATAPARVRVPATAPARVRAPTNRPPSHPQIGATRTETARTSRATARPRTAPVRVTIAPRDRATRHPPWNSSRTVRTPTPNGRTSMVSRPAKAIVTAPAEPSAPVLGGYPESVDTAQTPVRWVAE